MARSTLTWLRAAAIAALATQAIAQKCYYPNGSEAPNTEKPCSNAKGGSSCCPDTWECLDNGLCHNPNDDIYGRYSCTDKDWKAPGCASNMCTYGGTAGGGEALTQCSNHDDQWCCNADRIHVNCCQESPQPRPFFQLQDGKAYATIGRNQAANQPNVATFTGLASGSGGSSPSKTSAPVSSAAATTAPPSSSATPFESTSVSVSSGPAGFITVSRVITVTPSADPSASAASSANTTAPSGGGGSNSKLGVIIGCAVGIPLALALAGIIIWMLRKRSTQKSSAYKNSPELDGNSVDSPGFAGGAAARQEKYRHSRPGTTEIDGAPAGPGRPISNIPGRAELDSGTGFQAGHNAYAPDTVGLGGGNGDGRSTYSSAPPGYSPGMAQTGFHAHNASELDGTSVMPVINEKAEAPQQYQAYKPPNPAAAELPTVKTPPEDVEKQL
ncbi:hypothetical protein HBI56_184540 [Parastagonospora nodorum]|uniref:Mid2 domain-containing protein n=1 Tax=Phaeosphaeria nodorum (strain SN15 / ATCC MYA-4574 / FGSC 10173) TaxID=321614 RepID=A0A7U2I608_PHANO|nr:hypothetical protein HBH56_193000 [Parastagonospora nodorum]QRD02974.1 hypothetical protein JI435_142350 [Parastagonospora nodorum SN15]KAH3937728.1 hypothetical protein HBH54_008960 [Parastagonospora nodorum]KAH3938743.1 hypothetical protein HBH53_245420 [Parastagonospora nodorum]KAH3966470.1 hypothetical protein HBH52_197920 [Parastagonospora nodorum]